MVISFREEVLIPSKRAEINNFIDFLANAGGLFGLFMGASLLSIIELIYYFTLRIFYTKRAQQRTKRLAAQMPISNLQIHEIGHQPANNRIYNFLP